MDTYTELIGEATGLDISEHELIEIAERILTVEKSINILAGIERKDEYPPMRFFEPIPEGLSKGMCLNRKELDKLLKIHATLHNWAPETGIPQRTALEDMGLEEHFETNEVDIEILREKEIRNDY